MKKYLAPLVSALTVVLGVVLGKMNGNFFCGALAGAGIIFLVSTTIGNFILRQHVSRLDKVERDYLENIAESVENNTTSKT